MIGIGLGNLLYKDIMTKEEIKTLKEGKQVDFKEKAEGQKKRDWFVFFKVLGITCLFYLAYLIS